ncbi:hypothetical protein ALQ04_05423 [Pseudomonas cichorii]|uniref:Uncharacterized protein n=1 Tax=Pseudomonas cichorii TaxID=36746 RepID=A0A3M4MAQ4_PSECI|nr:hypothetical protein ALQ04_05423 [Pseudomonas cichorii]
MIGVIQVRLARPDISTRHVQFVEFMTPATVFMVDEQGFVELPEESIPVLILFLTGALQQCSRRGRRFTVGPVQTMAYYRAIFPVEGVDNPRCAIDVPGIPTGIGKQLAGIVQQPVRSRTTGALERRFQMQHQPRPLEGMPRRGAERTKTVGGIVAVIVGQRLPGLAEMLDDLEVIGRGMAMNDSLDNAQRPLKPLPVAGDIRQGQESLGTVHVAVGAAIGFLTLPVTGEGLAHRAFLIAPETAIDDVYRIGQQRLGARPSGHHGRTGGQGDKGMQIGLFVGLAALLQGRAEPATMLGIAQWPRQGRNAVVDQRRAARNALRVGHGKTVGHACGVHGLGRGTDHETAIVVETAETVFQPGSLGKGQQAHAFLRQPLMMTLRKQPTAEVVIIVHDAMLPPTIRNLPVVCPTVGNNARHGRSAASGPVQDLFQTLKLDTT